MANPGYPVVLTADRTLMAGYRLLFDGMLASSQTSTTPTALFSGLLMPWMPGDDVRSWVAPLGLRRIEAALLAGGFRQGDVAVVDERRLRDAIGPATRVVAVTSGEPIGRGMNSSTMTEIAGGAIYPEVMFRRLMNEVKRLVRACAPSARVVMGGPGAWQLAAEPGRLAAMGIDHVVTGYAEGNAAEVFHALTDGNDLPVVIAGNPVCAEDVPPIQGASTMGVVKISRGCGLGCSFCTIAGVEMIHIPESTVIADVRKNLESGMTSIAVLSEDFFRYSAKGTKARPEAVISLLRNLRAVDGLRLIQIDHANVSSVAQYSDDELCDVRDLLVGNTGCAYPWVNVGIESASGRLLKANGAPKMGACAASDWTSFTAEQLRRLCRAGFLPMASLLFGLPGETEEDTRCTLDWVKSMRDERITIFPMLYAPVNGERAMRARDLTALHWQIIRQSYKLNFKWIPRMYWDNQTGAGVGLGKRTLLQVMGRGQVLQWNALFAWHGLRARL